MNGLRHAATAALVITAFSGVVPVVAQTPDSSALATAVVREASRLSFLVDPLPPAMPTRWEAMLHTAFRAAHLPEPEDSSRLWWMRLGRSEIRYESDSAFVRVYLDTCGKGEGLARVGYVTDYVFSWVGDEWSLRREQPGPMGHGTCGPEGPEEPIEIPRADSVSLAAAVARVLAADQMTVRPLPPDTPDAWESMLLRQLDELDLPAAEPPLHWIQLRASRTEVYGRSALVSVHTDACFGEATLVLDAHVMIYEFVQNEDGWYHGNSRLKLSDVGRCDATGPEPQLSQ
jgi:hypothetical protein